MDALLDVIRYLDLTVGPILLILVRTALQSRPAKVSSDGSGDPSSQREATSSQEPIPVLLSS